MRPTHLMRLICGLAIVSMVSVQPGHAQRDTRNAPRAGVFDYYALVMSWSPTFCSDDDNSRSEQCRPRRDRPYAFVLHGLWPQYERGFPNNCPTGQRPFVPNRVISAMRDIMPGRGLIIHQYRKHGTCSGLKPSRYFGAARKLFEFIKIPPRYVAPRQALFVTQDELVRDFQAVNPGLRRDMIAVDCKRRPGNQLREIRICFTPKGRLRPCGQNERRSRMCRADKVYVPPVRYAR